MVARRGLDSLVGAVIEAGVTQIHPSHSGGGFLVVVRAPASWQVVFRASLKPPRNLATFICVGHAGPGLLDEGVVCLRRDNDIF